MEGNYISVSDLMIVAEVNGNFEMFNRNHHRVRDRSNSRNSE
jgi:hypothetical protein